MTVLLGATPEPTPAPAPDLDAPLADALTRFLTTKSAPDYLRTPATTWLARKATT